MRRLLVIGLDGATFRVLDPFSRDGVMPFVGSLMARGARGVLRSTDPPYTGPGWSSFMTGTNPGKHSNFDIQRRTPDFSGLEPVGYHTLAGTTLWDLASAAGLRTVLLNMPMSYPPPSLNGIVVSGALTPPGTRRYTFPESLVDEIEREFGPYVLDVSWAEYDAGQRESMLAALDAMTAQHEQMFLWALAREAWDVAVVVLVSPDRIQHALWHCLGVDGPVAAEDERLHDRVLSLYARMDQAVAKLVEAAGPDANVLVVSDHGFGPLKARVDLNNLLADLGLLSYRNERGIVDTVGKRLHAAGLRRRHVAALLRAFGARGGFVESLEAGNRLQGAGSVTDWRNTKAFCLITNGVFVNLRGRELRGVVSPNEYEGVRDALITRLCDVRDPDTGERVIYRVQRREEIYAGPFVDYAPDVMITGFDERYHFHFFPHSHYTHAFNPPERATGNHAYDGILIGLGPDIGTGPIEGARIIDLMPTLCALLGLDTPEDVDGHTLTRLLRNPPSEEPSRRGIAWADQPRPRLAEGEQEKLEERLRGLGYL